jgi:hypothetical protein
MTLRELVTALRLAAEAQVQVTPVAVSPVTRRLLDLTEIDLNDLSQRATPGIRRNDTSDRSCLAMHSTMRSSPAMRSSKRCAGY